MNPDYGCLILVFTVLQVLIDERELQPKVHLADNAPELTDGDIFIQDNIDEWASYLYPAAAVSSAALKASAALMAKKS